MTPPPTSTREQLAALNANVKTIYFQHHLDHKDDAFNRAVDDRVVLSLQPLHKSLEEMRERLATTEGEMKVLIAGKSISAVAFYAKRGDAINTEKYANDARAALASAITSKARHHLIILKCKYMN